jgi:hypothetical protein
MHALNILATLFINILSAPIVFLFAIFLYTGILYIVLKVFKYNSYDEEAACK